jgi:hypothetical protein
MKFLHEDSPEGNRFHQISGSAWAADQRRVRCARCADRAIPTFEAANVHGAVPRGGRRRLWATAVQRIVIERSTWVPRSSLYKRSLRVRGVSYGVDSADHGPADLFALWLVQVAANAGGAFNIEIDQHPCPYSEQNGDYILHLSWRARGPMDALPDGAGQNCPCRLDDLSLSFEPGGRPGRIYRRGSPAYSKGWLVWSGLLGGTLTVIARDSGGQRNPLKHAERAIHRFLERAASWGRLEIAADAHPDPENFHAFVAEAAWRRRDGSSIGEG